ncbi:MAG: M23 family metallopeptidase [Parvibaculaceae bacterium]|nr:M23 family metallopeptidase [Parvibaculaceae bacterium]
MSQKMSYRHVLQPLVEVGDLVFNRLRLAFIISTAFVVAACAGQSDPWWDTQYEYRSGSNVSAGDVGRPRSRPDDVRTTSNYSRPASRPNRDARPTPTNRPVARTSAGYHVVQRGDTVYSISTQYSVKQDDLRSANGIGGDNAIHVGQRLRIPGGSTAGQSQIADASGAPRPRVKPPLDTPPPATGEFIWPAEGRIVSRFGPKADGLHNDGVNIAVPEGTPVRVAQSGVVAYAGNELRGYGNLLLVRHSNGWMTAYAHNGELLVQRGATVTKGQTIALAGRTGSVQSSQIHFEIRRGSQAMDPLKVMSS